MGRIVKPARPSGEVGGQAILDDSRVRSNEETESLMKEHSRYIETTWMLSASKPLNIPRLRASIRYFSDAESQDLALTARKRNLFARHSWENPFYVRRIESLGDNTVIELFLRGQPDETIPFAEGMADLLEKLAVLSTTLVTNRRVLHHQLAISPHRRPYFDLTIGPRFYYLRSKSKSDPGIRPIVIDEKFLNRFQRCGFQQIAELCASEKEMAFRTRAALTWLFESRMESSLSAAVVKTAIALESLLIFDESEPIGKSLSERIALIVSRDPNMRRQLSSAVKKFYGSRSGIVHGGHRKTKSVMPSLVEGIDRITLLTCLTIAANPIMSDSVKVLSDYCEDQRWGAPDPKIRSPFPATYLSQAVKLCLKN